jgi:hypothetical protein
VQVKVGKFKTAFGKLGNIHLHMFPFILSALIYEQTIGGEGFNGEGAEASWLTPMPWFLEMTGGGYSAKAPGDGTVDFSGARKDDFVYSARARNFLDLPRNASLEFGGSLLAGHTTVGAAQRVLGLDLTLKNAPPRNVNPGTGGLVFGTPIPLGFRLVGWGTHRTGDPRPGRGLRANPHRGFPRPGSV